MLEKIVKVALEEGLHARPAAQIVKMAKGFDATVEIVKDTIVASGKSAVKIMLLGAKIGEEVTVRASGADAAAALAALAALIGGRPAEEPTTKVAQTKPNDAPARSGAGHQLNQDNSIAGVAASAGIAIGQAWLHIPERIKPSATTIGADQVEAKLAAFRAALAAFVSRTATDLASMKEAHPHSDVLGAEILTALINLANDPDFIAPIEARIGDCEDPVHATLTVGQELAASFRKLDDGYFTARAEDIEEIARQIASELLGLPILNSASLTEPCILVASSIGAIEFSRLPADRIKGLVCLEGAATSHLAILSRSLGIPAVLGLAADVDRLRGTKTVALDGGAGRVVFNPGQTEIDAFLKEADKLARESETLAPYTALAARTLDGIDIEIAANLNLPAEARQALKNGAMGVGLLRTEFLFLERRSLPSEDEQLAVYLDIARQFADRPVIIRTLDVGGDKSLPGLSARREDNPFLGWRGVRLCLDRPDIFKPQLRALLRAAAKGNVKIMVPMVADIAEIREVKALLANCAKELIAEGKAARIPELGIMIETPAAVMCASQLAEEVGFFSIGTNDLTQYTMAVDRLHTNPRLTRLCQASHPAVLRMIELTCQAARERGIWVGVCGEAAGDPALIPILLSYGVTEFSMESSQIPRAKKLVMESRVNPPA